MEKPFTLKINDLQQEIIKLINEANMPCYVLKHLLTEVIRLIEDTDGQEITKYFEEINKNKKPEKGDDK